MTFTYVLTEPVGMVRLLLNDVDEPTVVFSDEEITAFLTLEGDSVKRAAAQAIDTNATNEALASKVLRTQDVQTDGAKLADAMRKHAAELRAQATAQQIDDEADSSFTLVQPGLRRPCHPELTEHPVCDRRPYPFI